MTLNIGRKHWAVFAALLTMQLPAIAITATRAPHALNSDWSHFGLFAVPRSPFEYFIGAEMVLCSCFVSALIVVTLWDSIRTATE